MALLWSSKLDEGHSSSIGSRVLINREDLDALCVEEMAAVQPYDSLSYHDVSKSDWSLSFSFILEFVFISRLTEVDEELLLANEDLRPEDGLQHSFFIMVPLLF